MVGSWWRARSTPAKVGIVTGAVVGAGLVTWGIVRLTRPKPVRDISEGCNDFSFANQAEVEEAILPLLRAARTRHGPIDPFYVTTRFLKRYAPDCRSYPEEARNVGEAELYVQSFVKVVAVMEGERMLSPDQRKYFLEMVSVWGRMQGLSEQQLPAPGKEGGMEPTPASPAEPQAEEPYVPQP
jgi:hypothetical protein